MSEYERKLTFIKNDKDVTKKIKVLVFRVVKINADVRKEKVKCLSSRQIS